MPRPKITFDSDSEDSESETATPIFLTDSTVFQQRRPSVLEKLKQANDNWSKGNKSVRLYMFPLQLNRGHSTLTGSCV